jgi:hypothetical protein
VTRRGTGFRVVGHALVRSGGALVRFTDTGARARGAGAGKARVRCTCGATSEPGLTNFQALQWHRDHRVELSEGSTR